MKDPQTCPICGGHMECICQSTDTWECDTCDYTVGKGIGVSGETIVMEKYVNEMRNENNG